MEGTRMNDALQEFRHALAPRIAGELLFDEMSRALYATDASIYRMQPHAVLVPQTMDDVQAAIEEAARFAMPILPRGGGSSLAGQTVAEALVIDFTKHLDHILEIDEEARLVRVQPGLVLDRLNTALLPAGLMVGPDPASSNRATLGGMVGNNATGTHSILYGNIVDHVQALDVFLDDGASARFQETGAERWNQHIRSKGREGAIYQGLDRLLQAGAETIRRDTPRHWRRNSGYRLEHLLDKAARNPARLLCGSEGTLAITKEIVLQVVERPKRSALGVVHFNSLREALESVTTILETDPSAVELFDGIAIEQTRRAPGFAPRLTFIEGNPEAVLITEYFGDSEQQLTARLNDLKRVLARSKAGYAVVPARTPEEIANVWAVRKEGLGLIMGVEGEHKPIAFIEDASVPVEHLAEYVAALMLLLKDTRTVLYAHASAGTLHIRPFINTKDAEDVAKMHDIAQGSMELVRRFGGTVSSEHGDGLARSEFLEPLLGSELYRVYEETKNLFDPRGLLNPGKIVGAPPMTENLRMGPEYETLPIMEQLDFSDQGGFARSIELCNGSGACRKLDTGTMCPPFMVTRNEEDNTRGRANALREALSGGLPREALTGKRMYEVMDLCIQCKGCKTECPSNVDMARIKSEWLGMYWQKHAPSLRTRLLAHMPLMARRMNGSAARLVNGLNRQRGIRRLLERTMGLSPHRTLPSFAAEPFTKRFAKQETKNAPADGPLVLLFVDTFNNWNHPETAQAAAEFLRRAGFAVRVASETLCCGRPLFTKGFLKEARKQVRQAVDALYPWAEQGIPVVGLEPSCILTFRDEARALLPGDARVDTLAGQVFTFEEFVIGKADSFTGAVQWTDETRDVLLHEHCHQKALAGTAATTACLGLPPNYKVHTVDSGCCGMAGAFGYEAEHYDLSIAMAERRLAPAVRKTPEDTLIAAAGTSCRTQIFDTTGRKTFHPAEILLDALR
ncbi:MAG: FAD-binding protein [Bacteroidetes bacterium SB0662_bin_6]|nr:FAD-binding protein [Bacteroidetes bacterium SB0668_bin_1]MYE04530.1 FAD-binding protein [Bacteroidetes bacterium SB0662_bin_6]